jgi:hypothetical protein
MISLIIAVRYGLQVFIRYGEIRYETKLILIWTQTRIDISQFVIWGRGFPRDFDPSWAIPISFPF